MAPLLALLLATACVAVDGHGRETHVPQETTAAAAGADDEEAALLQFSFNTSQRGAHCCLNTDDTCCAYCLNDKGHHDKRVCVTRTTEEHDARPNCDSCGGQYTPTCIEYPCDGSWAYCAWKC
mmetsp:Transcript_9070/g.18185  ORF Transcript_9070/g.18185 Transcript_9070/m.18185 type:complete len:123 (-) Transcript_9070:132-500(-)